MYRFLMVCLFSLAVSSPVFSQEPLRYRLNAVESSFDRYLGNQEVGTIKAQRFQLTIDDSNHVRRLDLEYEKFGNKIPQSFGLELPKEELSFGTDLPVGKRCDLTFAANMATYLLGDDYWAWGLYPSYRREKIRVALGVERDQEETFLSYAYTRFKPGQYEIFFGGSEERFQERLAEIETRHHERLGFGLLLPIRKLRMQGYTGLTQNFDLDQSTWTVGLAKLANLRSSGLNPAGFVALREKPEGRYGLGLFTLWGRTLNEHVCENLFQSFFRGSFNRSRVVRNRDFGTVGVGRGYDVQDFGRISFFVSYLDIEAGREAHLLSKEYALYGTLPGNFSGLDNPYLGLIYSRSSDLIYDFTRHRLLDPVQEWYELVIGSKLQLFQRPKPRLSRSFFQSGYIRLQVRARFEEASQGVFLESTFWY